MASQKTPFKGVGGYSPEAFAQKGVTAPFPQANTEAEDWQSIFAKFRDFEPANLKGKDLLDFGSGYGGRTIEYSRYCREIIGVEPDQRHIDLSKEYAKERGVTNCSFLLCSDTIIPVEDASFDLVVSYDVMEHVSSPPKSLAELSRVLRSGGHAYLVFPPYDGAFAHHLDYISLLPALHWFFSPATLVEAVNSILDSHEGHRFGTLRQPAPKNSYDGTRKVMPSLNGLTTKRFLEQVDPFFEVEQIHQHTVFRKIAQRLGLEQSLTGGIRLMEWALKFFPQGLRDRFIFSVAVVLIKK